MSAQETIDALKVTSMHGVRSHVANQLRQPLITGILQAAAQAHAGKVLDAGVLCVAVTFVLSDFVHHYYPPEMREPMLAALTDLLARSVRHLPDKPA